jgi:hypothetical protein
MKRMALLIISLILLVTLAACGGDDEDVELKTVGGGAEKDAEATSAAVAANFDGAMVYVKGNALYYYAPGSGQDPLFLTDQFDPISLTLSPDRRALLFDTINYGDGVLYALDTQTRAIRELPSTFESRSASTWGVVSWSPDLQWAIAFLWPIGIEALRLDGQASYELSDTVDTGTFWLNDGSILLVRQDFSGFGPGQGDVIFRGVSRMDLTTGQVEDWEVDLEALAQDFDGTIAALLAEHNLSFPGDEDAVNNAGVLANAGEAGVFVNPPENFFTFTSTASTCDNWTFVSAAPVPDGGEPEVLYEAQQTYKVTDFQILNDGSWLFLEAKLPNCRISEVPVVSLVRKAPDGEPQVVTDNIFSEVDLSRRRLNLGNTGVISLSDDQQRVLWTGGTAEGGESTINLTDLATGDTQTLLTETRGEGVSPEAFGANAMYRAVYWIAP